VRQKVLQHLVVAVWNRLDHALHVAFICLYQTLKILLRGFNHIMITRAEKLSIRFPKKPEALAQLLEQSLMLYPVFTSAFREIWT
jgi:hypothetical protein